MFKRHKIKLVFLLGLILSVIFLMPGVFGYFKYKNAVAEAVSAGYPWQCGVTSITTVIPKCVLVDGVCSCSLCQASCVGYYDEVIFVGQPSCNGATYACVMTGTPIKGGGTTLVAGVGGQGIFAGTTNMQMGANDIIALPGSVAAGKIDQLVNWFDKYIIAGFKGN